MSHLTEGAWLMLKRLIRYYKGTKDAKIEMIKPTDTPAGIVNLDGYSDSDWADETSTRKSRSSGHLKADGCPIHAPRHPKTDAHTRLANASLSRILQASDTNVSRPEQNLERLFSP